MYSSHDATKQHDKVYALLGLSADPITTALTLNYDLSWDEVFKWVTKHIFPECSVETRSETDTAVVKGKGRILGHINSVGEDTHEFGQQDVKVHFNDIAQSLSYQNEWGTDWKLQASAQSFQDGDIICLLQGASKPSIIRLCKDHFTIITPAVTPPSQHGKSLNGIPQIMYAMGGYCNIHLTWRIPLARRNKAGLQDALMLIDMAPHYQEDHSEAENRLNHTTLVIAHIAMKELKVARPESKTIEHLLYQSGTKGPIAQDLVEAAVKDSQSPEDRILQTLLQH